MALTFFNIRGQLVNLGILTAFIETKYIIAIVVLVGNESMRLKKRRNKIKISKMQGRITFG